MTLSKALFIHLVPSGSTFVLLSAAASMSFSACTKEPTQPPPESSPSALASATPSATPSSTTNSEIKADDAFIPKVGDMAPALVATGSNGVKVELGAYKGKFVVVYFYPKDDTPGCTKEACAFRDAWSKLEKGGVFVIGVSHDDNASHKAFADKLKLPFPLVADPDGNVGKMFGVKTVKDTYYERVSFPIGPDGKVKKVYPKVDPAVHVDEILADVAAAKGK